MGNVRPNWFKKSSLVVDESILKVESPGSKLTHITAMPLIKEGVSLKPDMAFGWQPEIDCLRPPIPLCFDFVEQPLHIYNFE